MAVFSLDRAWFLVRFPAQDAWQWYGGQWLKTDRWKEGPVLRHWRSGEMWHLAVEQQETFDLLLHDDWQGRVLDVDAGHALWHYEAYRQAVEAARRQMAAGPLEKVVLSTAWRYPLLSRDEAALGAWAQRASLLHPEAMVWLASSGDGIVWGGATPEPLLRSDAQRWMTVALAGTQDAASSFSGKEYREHESVVLHIRRGLRDAAVPFREGDTEVIRSGRLYHLMRRFEGDLPAATDRMLDRLHPTPAVVGAPVRSAMDFILAHEPHRRRLYTGLVGIYSEKEPQLWVNLRCFRLNVPACNVLLYAGGGITAASIPVAEWEEIRRKIATILRPWQMIG